MVAYVLKRASASFLVLIGVFSMIFFFVRIIPGDPVRLILGPNAPQDQVDRARAELGLDGSLIEQYLRFMVDGFRLDFGSSVRLGDPAFEVVFDRLPATLLLAVSTMLIIVASSFILGILAAIHRDGLLDRTLTAASLTGQSLPVFWVGLMLIMLFSRQWGVLPSSGYGTWRHLIMPTVTLALPYISMQARLVRTGLLEALGQDYTQTALAKGAGYVYVVLRHSLRNALLPVVTVIGLQFGHLLGGAIVVETVFAWPGIGRLLVDSILNRDYSVVQAAVAFMTAAFLVVNFVVDVVYRMIDPRVELAEGSKT